MKKYYTGPLKIATVKDVILNQNNNDDTKYSYSLDIETIKENNLFYKNFMDVIIDDETNFPIFMETELHDLFLASLKSDSSKKHSFVFADATELTRIYTQPKEAKTLKKTILNKIKK